MGPRRKGDIAEFRAALWLLEQGWEVFSNVSGMGQIDLVGLDRFSGFHRIDVKTVGRMTRNGVTTRCFNRPTTSQLELGVRILYVDGNDVYWEEDRPRTHTE